MSYPYPVFIPPVSPAVKWSWGPLEGTPWMYAVVRLVPPQVTGSNLPVFLACLGADIQVEESEASAFERKHNKL